MGGRLEGRVALVTGASRGIGRAIAEAYGREGARLGLFARSQQELEKVAAAVSGETLVLPGDVTRAQDVNSAVERLLAQWGRIDVLVNNAGVGHFAPLSDLTEEQWDHMMAVNLKGPFLCTKAVWPIFVRQKGGHVINISSVAGTTTKEGGAGYSATKWGLRAVTDTLMKEAKPHKIKVSLIAPGSVDTYFNDKAPGQGPSHALKPEDVAQVALDIAAAPPGVILNEVIMRPLVPPVR
ncbi:MAG: SDR family oxidoreductase [Bacillota bacterium]